MEGNSTYRPQREAMSTEDLISAAGLPLRASVGFLVYPALHEKRAWEPRLSYIAS